MTLELSHISVGLFCQKFLKGRVLEEVKEYGILPRRVSQGDGVHSDADQCQLRPADNCYPYNGDEQGDSGDEEDHIDLAVTT